MGEVYSPFSTAFLHKQVVCNVYTVVVLPETFPLLRAMLNLLNEILGCSKPATNLMQAQKHWVGFLLQYIQALLNRLQ
jgi:hypothetical protein